MTTNEMLMFLSLFVVFVFVNWLVSRIPKVANTKILRFHRWWLLKTRKRSEGEAMRKNIRNNFSAEKQNHLRPK